jgi:hypothetical protein
MVSLVKIDIAITLSRCFSTKPSYFANVGIQLQWPRLCAYSVIFYLFGGFPGGCSVFFQSRSIPSNPFWIRK